MRAKTLIELLTLSTNLYMISKDPEFLDNLSEMTRKGKNKVNEIIDGFTGEKETDEETLTGKLVVKLRQAREELNHKMEEIAVKVYGKMNIAHTKDLKKVLEKIEALEKQVGLIESQLAKMGNPRA